MLKFKPKHYLQTPFTCGLDFLVLLIVVCFCLLFVLSISGCSYAPVRDVIGYTDTKCTNMGFVKGTKEHANCQLELEIQYSKNAALKNAAWQLRNK